MGERGVKMQFIEYITEHSDRIAITSIDSGELVRMKEVIDVVSRDIGEAEYNELLKKRQLTIDGIKITMLD